MKKRNIADMAEFGRDHISNSSDIHMNEINALSDYIVHCPKGFQNGLYKLITTAFYFGVAVGIKSERSK